MNYNKLYYFYTITKTKNLFEAADRLCISQPALSKAIKSLESDFNTTLFEHVGRNLKLTAAGEVLRRECADIFKNESAIIRKMELAASEEVVTLRFGYMLFNELFTLVPIIKSFNSGHSLIHVESRPYTERTDLNADLLSGNIDAALRIFTPEEIVPEIEYHTLNETHLSLVVSDSNPLAQKESLHVSDLSGEDFIFLGTDEHSSEYRFAKEWCAKCGFQPNIIMSFDWIGAVLLMVQAGSGVSILSDFAPIKMMSSLTSIPIANAPAIYSGLFWKKDESRPAVFEFLDYYINSKFRS